MQDRIRLTQFSKGGGCGCKIAPSVLEQMLHTKDHSTFQGLLVGNESSDDAAVFQLDDKRAIDPYRRNLQKMYIEKLRTLLSAPGSSPLPVAANYVSDVRSVIRGHIKQLGHDIKTRLQTPADTMTRYHLDDLLSRIDEILHPK